MAKYICVTCGVQYPESETPRNGCPICQDPRQFVGLDGQKWTTLAEMGGRYRNRIQEEEPGLYSIHTEPVFGIGQRAFLVQSRRGNLLWDCVTLLDEETVARIRELGGIDAIAISHPHYYASMIDWSATFGDAPIYLHEADAQWVMRPDGRVRFWSGESTILLDSLTLILTPGHFDGFQVLHWSAGAGGRGALLSGDQPQVCMDIRWVSFMYSYPNWTPLAPAVVRRIADTLRTYRFDRIYGAFPRRTVMSDGNAVVERSAERYLQAVSDEGRVYTGRDLGG
ncbi:MAG TPA: MBL fold metallo-hydrolase [Bryobacteraceae bacterium]